VIGITPEVNTLLIAPAKSAPSEGWANLETKIELIPDLQTKKLKLREPLHALLILYAL